MDYHIFFDDGGVLNNNQQRGLKWQNLIGEFFQSKYGGSLEDWGQANVKAMMHEISTYQSLEPDTPFDPNHQLFADWILDMFDAMHIPLDEDPFVMRQKTIEYIIPKAHAPFPGIIEAVKTLAPHFTLHTASNERSEELELYLQGMGIRNCFDKSYGPDLVGLFIKRSPMHYQRIFDQLAIHPSQAIIIDDTPQIIDIIEKVGATPIQSLFPRTHQASTTHAFETAEELLDCIRNITGYDL
ncbi:MAG: HAD family hydrolase [Candidatus Heimdallarchaeota archaeon]|nr:HAD family hydrolase [Candidatus Heimdallarchaeota archaeon]